MTGCLHASPRYTLIREEPSNLGRFTTVVHESTHGAAPSVGGLPAGGRVRCGSVSEGAGGGFGDGLVLVTGSSADADDLAVALERVPPAKIITRPSLEAWMP